MRSGGRNASVLAERVVVLRQTRTLAARLDNVHHAFEVEDYDAAVQTLVPSLSLGEREGNR